MSLDASTLPQDSLPTGELPKDTLSAEDPTAAPMMPQSLVDNPDPNTVPDTTEAAPSTSMVDVNNQAIAGPPSAVPNLPAGNATVGQRIVHAALQYLNTPYVWGGTSAAGVDCSGLVQLAYKAAGINLPRISYQQANTGTRVPIKQLRPGDLVAWDNSSRNPGADHIAIYAGNGYVIEAPHPGGHVQYVKLYDLSQAFGVRMGW